MRLPLLLLVSGWLGSRPAPAQQLTLTHANVVDVQTGKILPDQTVVIAGARIVRVGPSARPTPPWAGPSD